MISEKEIPEGWVLSKVEKTGILLRGVNYKKEEAFKEPKEGYLPILRGNNISDGNLNFEDLVFVPKKNVGSNQIIKKGDIVFAMSSGSKHLVGKSAKALSDFNGSYGAFCAAFRPNENINKNFISYFFQGPNYKNLISQISKGTNINNLKREHILDLIIPIPSPAEQQRIVAKIEELFSEVDKGIETLETARQQLKTYRQSVLKWAFEGKLTHPDVKDGELPEGWEWVKINEVANVGTGATPLKGKKAYYEKGEIPWITSGALNDEFVSIATDFVTDKALQETNLKVYPKHTLLLAMYGEGKTRGKCSELLISACTNQAIAAISFEGFDISIKPYLKYFLLKNYNDIRRKSSGGVQPNLNLGIVKSITFPLCSPEEQQQIVSEIESRLSVADKMEESITQSLQQANALKQSILKMAFEGRLV